MWPFRSFAGLGLWMGLQPKDSGFRNREKHRELYELQDNENNISKMFWRNTTVTFWMTGARSSSGPLVLRPQFGWSSRDKYHLEVTLSKGAEGIWTSETEHGGQNRFESPKLWKATKGPVFNYSKWKGAEEWGKKRMCLLCPGPEILTSKQ